MAISVSNIGREESTISKSKPAKRINYMKVAVMQPYLFPYLGYFQLMREADVFISLDDVQYIKGGWINRNRVLLDQEEYLYTFSIQNDSHKKNINERFFTPDFPEQCEKFLRVLQTAYGNAPYFKRTTNLVSRVLKNMQGKQEEDIGVKIHRSLQILSDYLGLDISLYLSSNISLKDSLKGEERIIKICKQLGCNHYINPPGGKELYDKDSFYKNDITLSFLEPNLVEYPQYSEEFIPGLSIIDALMFNKRSAVAELLNQYHLSN